MITVVKAKPVAKPAIGDVLYGREYLKRVEIHTIELFNHPQEEPNRLVISRIHGFDLVDIGISATALLPKVEYECPWTKNTYYWMYPLGVVTTDEKKYGRDRNETPWLCPIIDQHDGLEHRDPSRFNRIVTTMLGHGFTRFTLPTDGHGETVMATVPLDNGDELLVACWVWFNK